MLTHIQIRDFAIIDAVELEFPGGLTVLTGETGAGKSILVDALLLAVGGRGGAELVRHGAERAEISAAFALRGNDAAITWLTEQAIEHDGEAVLRRIVSSDGRSRAWVNGQSMSVQSVRQLGELLLDVHGQMEYQSLVRRAAQRDLLDRHGGNLELVATVRERWGALKAVRSERDAALASAAERGSRLDLVRYHLNELEGLAPRSGEYAELHQERQRLAQRGRLAEGAVEIASLLREADGSNAEQQLERALSVSRALTSLDSQVAAVTQLVEESLIAAREAVRSIDHYRESLDADPGRQDWLESRLAAIEAVARKHRVEPDGLADLEVELRREAEALENYTLHMDRIETVLRTAEDAYRATCNRLSDARRSSADALSARVTSLMQSLGMPGGRFVVELTTLAADEAGDSGQDYIEFLVGANPGQPPRPLAKVASGGELSRISLAIQVAAIEDASLPCLVFDEVDTGVGGGVAEIVGRQLRLLGERAQVLCVTHLPQVASQAHHHIRVAKLTDGRTTRTVVTDLAAAERVEEIARMLGGVEVTATAREHADEMLAEAARKGRSGSSGRRRRSSR
jgi:DNA repair protein RecN (Recombination protein N)